MTDDRLILSAADWCYIKDSAKAPDYYQRLTHSDYAAAELVPPERRAMARAAGLRLLNMIGASGLNRADNRPRTVEKLRAQISEASAEGIEQLIVFSGTRGDQEQSIGINNCIAALKGVASEAEAAGVLLTLEPFNTFNHPDCDADNSDYAFEVARAVSSPAVKVLYDLYHMHRMREDVAAKVMRNLEYVAHLHIAGSPHRDFPGDQQEMNYCAIVRRIHQAGYRGAWGMEFLPAADGDVRETLAAAARLFRGYLS